MVNNFEFILIGSVLFLCSCDQLKDVSLPIEDQNESREASNNEIKQKIKPNSFTEVEQKTVEESSKPELPEPLDIAPVVPTDPKPEIASNPVLPEFSEALLNAVSNWTKIPPSVFPLSSITINQEVNFILKSSNNEIIGNAKKSPGEEVVAMGIYQGDLIVAPSLNARTRGRIQINQTDFKQGVAYLFELRNKQRTEFEKRKAELTEGRTLKDKKMSKNHPNQEESLFEDIPIPGDFGHGKFCICKDCREKRLAATGSLK